MRYQWHMTVLLERRKTGVNIFESLLLIHIYLTFKADRQPYYESLKYEGDSKFSVENLESHISR